MKELERALAARLLQRGAGRGAADRGRRGRTGPGARVQAAVDDLLAAAAAFQGGEVGRVRLGTGATACIYLLPPLLARMKQRMPGLEIIIATGNTPEILGRVLAGGLDLALVTLAGRLDRALEARRLTTEPLVAYAPARDAAGCGGALRPAQLAALPLILYESGGATRGLVDAWFRRAGLAPRPIMELGSVEAIKVLVESGLGATILPRTALAAAGAGGPGAWRCARCIPLPHASWRWCCAGQAARSRPACVPGGTARPRSGRGASHMRCVGPVESARGSAPEPRQEALPPGPPAKAEPLQSICLAGWRGGEWRVRAASPRWRCHSHPPFPPPPPAG